MTPSPRSFVSRFGAIRRAFSGIEPRRYSARTADGWDLALYRYGPSLPLPGQSPVFLCHGLGANRYNLDAPGDLSFAKWMHGLGHDVWVVELRGAGHSTKPRLGSGLRYDWTFDDYVLKDIPAALAVIRRETGQAQVHWVGHSMGGMIAYGHAIQCARQGIDDGLRSVTAVGSPSFARVHWPLVGRIVGLRKILKMLPRIPYGGPAYLLAPIMPLVKETAGRIFGNPRNLSTIDMMKLVCVVPQDLPPTLIAQFADWYAEHGFSTHDARSYADDLHLITAPALIVAGPVDYLTPPRDLRHVHDTIASRDKRFLECGRATGCVADYGHIDLILGFRAKDEVWPHIRSWIEVH